MPDDELYLLCQHLVSLSADALEYPPPNQFVSLAKPPMDDCDSLSAWVSRIYFSTQFPTAIAVPGPCMDGWVAQCGVRIVRPCWPVPTQSQAQPLPNYLDVDAAAQERLVEVRKILNALNTALGSRPTAITPWAGRTGMIDQAVPVPPAGGCAGWEITLRVQVP